MGKKTSIKIEDGVINVNEHIFKIPTIKLEKIEESFISENPTEEIIFKSI
jgi:ribosomal protein S4